MRFQSASTGRQWPVVIALMVLVASLVSVGSFVRASVNVGIEHDMTQPTYGLEGKTGSTINYDTKNGFNLGGTINDLLGPPIKIANGFNSIIKGNNMASMGTGLKTGGALLGFDAKMLETAGAGNLFKSQLLLSPFQQRYGPAATGQTKTNEATGQTKTGDGYAPAGGDMGGFKTPKGQKIASIIEIPVKVVALKDLAEGKALTALGAAKAAGANQMTSKGQTLMSQGQALKSQGLNQIVQGATEGVQNIGNMFQRTSDNMNTAFKLFPLIMDMQAQDAAKGQQQVQQQQAQQQQQQVVKERPVSTPYQMSSPTGGSLFGGLASLIPSLSSSALSGNHGPGSGPNPSYAALWNTSSPLTNLLTNPAASPFLLPFTTGPLGQAIVAKQPIGTAEASSANGAPMRGGLLTTGAGSQSFDFSLLPGVRYRETVSSALPGMGSMGKRPAGGDSSVSASKTGQQQQVQQQQVQEVASSKGSKSA